MTPTLWSSRLSCSKVHSPMDCLDRARESILASQMVEPQASSDRIRVRRWIFWRTRPLKTLRDVRAAFGAQPSLSTPLAPICANPNTVHLSKNATGQKRSILGIAVLKMAVRTLNRKELELARYDSGMDFGLPACGQDPPTGVL